MAGDRKIELDTQLPLDGRAELTGRLAGDDVPPSLSVIAVDAQVPCMTVPLGLDGAFVIPLRELAPGYYHLLEAADGAGATFAVPGLGLVAPSGPSSYLDFVLGAIEILRERQSCRFGGDPKGPLALTVSGPISRSYLSLGHRDNDAFRTYWFPERPLELEPVLLDFELWPVLMQLADLTGEPGYAALVEGMAGVFARHGFHPDSGLGYLGEEAGFDCLHLCGAPTKATNAEPIFKPKNSGHFPAMPLDVLWRHAPEKMHRMFRSMYWGLVTDAASMDFNRFCRYDYRDAEKRPSMERNPGHCGFETAAARMIHWWCSAYRQTGDTDCLDYAERMLSKWEAIQHPESGLVPNFFGAVSPEPGAPMPPGEWAELRGTALMADGLLDAAAELAGRGGQGELVARLREMALRLAVGTARFGYDRPARLYHEWLHLDGRLYEATARYVFQTQEEKNAAVREDPSLERVRVYRGGGLFRNQSYWEFCAGTRIPLQLARVAEETGDPELLDLLVPVAEDAGEETRRQPEAFTQEGGWTFRASGMYIELLLSLWRQTGETRYLSGAREMADQELERLGRVLAPDWWRMPERTAMLDALLNLHASTLETAT